MSGHSTGVRVWRVKDAKQMADMQSGCINCLAVSKDGRWIAAGTNLYGEVYVWDATTYEQVLVHQGCYTHAVNFSPDSARLVVASNSGTATIWDLVSRERVQTLRHDGWVLSAKYSPQGDRIVTATRLGQVRVWDSNDGRLLVEIEVNVTPLWNNGLLWLNDHLFVVSDGKIKKFDASTGSIVSEWSIRECDDYSGIALPSNGEFLAYSTKRTVTFWDISTCTQLALIQRPKDIHSVAFSPDDRFLAIGGKDGKINIESLSRINVSSVSLDYCTFGQVRLTLLRRWQSHCLVYTQLSRNPTSSLTMLSLTHGNTTSWKAPTHY